MAQVKAMRDNESEKEAVKEAVAAEDQVENSSDDEVDGNDDTEEIVDDEEDVGTNASEDDGDADDSDYDEEDEIDIGSYIGLVLEDEEVFGTIIEFDDDEGLVTI